MILVISTFIFASCWMILRDVVNRELVSRVKLSVVSVFPDIVKHCRTIRNRPKVFPKKFRECGPWFLVVLCPLLYIMNFCNAFQVQCRGVGRP